jgi:carbamoyl-phosphate synthase large subunit
LKEDGYRVILINSNPATIMTDPDTADAIYIEPITANTVAEIIKQEQPDAILPTMGGQTGLNVALQLSENGILDQYNVELIGAKKEAIAKAEDRDLFREAMHKIGLQCPKSIVITTKQEIDFALQEIGLPAIIRPSFTMGGTGGGIAHTKADFHEICNRGLVLSPTSSLLIDESIIGWKEFEMEVVRDKNDNAIIVCSIENVDPMGIHTGDSITVAPALTLSDKEYQVMRNASLAVLREIGVETGGSNVQFAINPDNGRLVVIEMNPRVSRSSALASKATGFPIAKVAAKLAVGYTLDEIDNDITGGKTPCSFEPTIDYVVTKIPRFAFEKFPNIKPELSTYMQSVGETMAIGRTFAESLQKALISMEDSHTGLDDLPLDNIEELKKQTPYRVLLCAQALRQCYSVEQIYARTKIDPWFLHQISAIVVAENAIASDGLPETKQGWLKIKQLGFGDERLAFLHNCSVEDVTKARKKHDITPVYKRIDTCAAEIPSDTAYMYSSYEAPLFQEQAMCEANVSRNDKIIVIGAGPNRIGQGIEFDYCCVHAIKAAKAMGIETIMVNCNPETVSTDYDTSDRLYFEPLVEENVLNICNLEAKSGNLLGVIVQFGGQTPLKLANFLKQNGITILGTQPEDIDLAEDRDMFQKLITNLNLKQPANGIAYNTQEALVCGGKVGMPVVVRPSHVLGGRAMRIIEDATALEKYADYAFKTFKNNALLIDKYLENAIELDVDALRDTDDNIIIAGIMEHIEPAGIHSGDSACVLPTFSIKDAILAEVKRQTKLIATNLNVCGAINIQFAIKDDVVYLIEANPRASRTIPFIAKATGVQIAKIATELMLGEKLSDPKYQPEITKLTNKSGLFAVKEAVFPFNKFIGYDPMLGPEMKSTGEVMARDDDLEVAFMKAQIAAGHNLPVKGTVAISVCDKDKPNIIAMASKLASLGFALCATGGTATFLNAHNIQATTVHKVNSGAKTNIVDLITDDKIHMIINTTHGEQSQIDSASIRSTAITKQVPCFTTIRAAEMAVKGLAKFIADPECILSTYKL